ncbi:NUDIX domain-containing protein [Marinihelvus fidelis]|uniref:Oxidized purine nucleoside triphosphate hydrolase n=1 Tax=Marinihelvus fidelis TaxID=2613842 RepID=A0A5N0T9B2_9GAMM|nr:NUDIX domain-containing protein [Marinihelvus fidelis]
MADIDWSRWTPVDRATLVFVLSGDDILLIEKKRGLGGGKVNGPGGKVDPGESVEQCAIRECKEELGIDVSELEQLGEHRFQFVDGYSIHCWVFRTSKWGGEPVETDEAVPLWRRTDAIPYERMWEDDHIWLPLILEGKAFTADWIFEDDTMLDHRLTLLAQAPGAPTE